MEHFSDYKRQVANDEDDQRFHDANMFREARYESSEESKNHSDASGTEDNNEEGSYSSNDVHWKNVVCSDLTQAFEQMVEHLEMNRTSSTQISVEGSRKDAMERYNEGRKTQRLSDNDDQ